MLKKLFVGPNGIRAGWRLAIFIAMLQLISGPPRVLIYRTFGYTEHPVWHPVDFIISEGGVFLVTLLTGQLMRLFVERKRWSFQHYGLGGKSAFPLFLSGSLWALALASLLVVLIYASGGVSFNGLRVGGSELLRYAFLWLIAMLLLGCSEEFLFRGYPLFTLSTGMGFWPAAILLSLLFGGLHYFTKPMETWIDATSVTALGFFLCLSLRRTGNLWFAIGFHAFFDYAALVLFSAPNSGNQGKSVEGAILRTSFSGPDWLTGGPCGIEASVLILPLIVGMFLLFNRIYREAIYP